MEIVEDNIDRFLPYGLSLQAILNHPSISKADIKHLLRLKGIFIDDLSVENTFPLLSTTLLSPSEFEYLKDKLQSREDRKKIITRTLDWSSDTSLINALPENFNIQEVIQSAFPKYKVLGNPDFTMSDDSPEKVELRFKCESLSYDQAWFRTKKEFEGEVVIEKIVQGKQVQLQIVHTSPETTEVSNKVVKHLERHFKEEGHMDAQKEIRAIKFGDFTNESRMSFFLSLTSGNHIFDFKRSINVDIGPSSVDNSLPEDINWMELGQVRELEINGDVLHEISFIKDKTKHKYLEIANMELEYDFAYASAEGKCRVTFGFNGYFKRKESSTEFSVDISKINLKEEYMSVSLKSVQRHLLEEFEKFKTEKLNRVFAN